MDPGEGGLGIVDISGKPVVERRAVAEGRLILSSSTVEAVRRGKVPKGDVLGAAKVAGLQAVKRTPDALPHCHPIPIAAANVLMDLQEAGIGCRCEVRATYGTGVEMEALHGCAIALLTACDMVKSLEKDRRGQYPHISIGDLRVVSKEKGA